MPLKLKLKIIHLVLINLLISWIFTMYVKTLKVRSKTKTYIIVPNMHILYGLKKKKIVLVLYKHQIMLKLGTTNFLI